ncbi:MAG TPA: type II secretion system protein [Tepidisphaeraceae bacterium]|nr:type II secretion system protein [Tepidisphaeraceae bacterium]
MRRFVRSGFTILELLVVIGIILVLVSILLPSIKSARQASLQVLCASRLHTLGHAFIAYASGNEGQMVTCKASGVSSRNWVFWQAGRNINQSALAPYLGLRDDALRNAFRCPAAFPEEGQGFSGGRAYPLTFTMNAFLNRYRTMTYQKVKNPANKIVVYDENENADDDIFWYQTARDTLAARHGSRSEQVAGINGAAAATLYREMGNVLYFDGHVDLADNNMCHTATNNDPTVP